MSLQDDYFDVAAYLEANAPAELQQFERIWFAFCDYETQEMCDRGEMTGKQYLDWKQTRMKELGLKG
jgi:hypothetical protein